MPTKTKQEIAEFTGFAGATTAFLADLAANNDKDWFDKHRPDYDEHWVKPAKEFALAAGEALQELAPVAIAPRINGNIFRINRDVRFSPDKTPYKDHLDFWFWEGERKTAVSGFFVRITPNQLGIGVGAHRFDKDRLQRYRDAVVDPDAGRRLVAAVKAVEKEGWTVKGEHYKKLPRGYDATNEMQERLLRHSALWTGDDIELPRSASSRRLVAYCMHRWAKLEPLHRWLVDTLQ